jgi:hypothetical protein
MLFERVNEKNNVRERRREGSFGVGYHVISGAILEMRH